MEYIVGICDDEREQVTLVTNLLEDYRCGFGRGNTYQIAGFDDPIAFLVWCRDAKPDLVFLDIDMKNMNGIDLAKKITEMHRGTVIVYITGFKRYALDAFKVRAFHYLVKPVTKEVFKDVMDEVFNYLEKIRENPEDKKLVIATKKELVTIRQEDIYYFEKEGHKIKVYLSDQVFVYYDNFINLLKQIGDDHFIRCHQGYIVNMDKVRSIQKQKLYLRDCLNDGIPVSRSYYKTVKEVLSKRLFAK